MHEVEQRGWTHIEGIDNEASLLGLAKSIGRPLRSATGEFVKELRIMPCSEAAPKTLSGTFGTGGFPLHTDTAFWAVPARYLVMRVIGDKRRTTPVCAFSTLFERSGGLKVESIQKSVWSLRASTGAVYCKMTLPTRTASPGLRYDRQCMTPANAAAREVEAFLSSLTDNVVQEISWSDGMAVVIDNWRSLHGRGQEPPQERSRILQRIYVGVTE